MVRAEVTSYLPYHEPGIVTILILSSFLLVLNVLNSIFDSLIYCGLLAQVFIGVAWGTPGGKILGPEFENVVVQLGYLGLILLVYEGGLTTNVKSLKANILLSSLVALTGISLPMGLSFTLAPLLNATPLQCFAAGAALCSTSLGTTFTILRTSGLAKSRLGVVLTAAAMMDDVVGLVMVQIISNLGSAGSEDFGWKTVVRPLGVSMAFAVGVPSTCWALQPLARKQVGGFTHRVFEWDHSPFLIQATFLLGMVTAAIYAGTSGLFAAYLTGAVVSWWDDMRKLDTENASDSTGETVAVIPARQSLVEGNRPLGSERTGLANSETHRVYPKKHMTGVKVYEMYYTTAVHRVLKPFFFASIGFAIPITEMFDAQIVWRGIVYTILMTVAKLCTGLWLVRLNVLKPGMQVPKSLKIVLYKALGCLNQKSRVVANGKKLKINSTHEHEMEAIDATNPAPTDSKSGTANVAGNSGMASSESATQALASQKSSIQKPQSLYPAAMLGTAMTARGEIGFLIASVAAANGLFDSTAQSAEKPSGSPQIYLVVIWAVVLCTIIGPLSVGTLVRRVKRLEGKKLERNERGIEGPLGIWGLE